MNDDRRKRWAGRPLASACLRLATLVLPMAVSVVAGITAAHSAHGRLPTAAVFAVSIVVSTAALIASDRLTRRLLPLAVLLNLGLAFPKEAPSRIAIARAAAGVKDLEARIERAKREGFYDEPTRAAVEILTLVAAVEAHDRATRGHSERVRIYTDLLAEQLRLSRHERDRLRWASLLHDVGKLKVPAPVLNKPAKPSPEEWEMIRGHPSEGARLTAPLRPWLAEWALAIDEHHERYDGNGYPYGRSGDGISLAGRIVAVADSYEVMTASRPYRRAIGAVAAREELVRCSGSQFDPGIVRAFLEISVRRLSWATGPFSWAAQSPVLWGLSQAANAGRVAVAGAGALALPLLPFVPGDAGGAGERPPAAVSASDGEYDPVPDGDPQLVGVVTDASPSPNADGGEAEPGVEAEPDRRAQPEPQPEASPSAPPTSPADPDDDRPAPQPTPTVIATPEPSETGVPRPQASPSPMPTATVGGGGTWTGGSPGPVPSLPRPGPQPQE